MKTLASPGTLPELEQRILTVAPEDHALWGRMNASQMICHLRDALRLPLGQITVAPATLGIPRPLLKFLALSAPVRWRQNIPTMPVFDQCRPGAPTPRFQQDVQELLAFTRQLMNDPVAGRLHPYFGPLTREEWMRWAWLHADHHLRQFGR